MFPKRGLAGRPILGVIVAVVFLLPGTRLSAKPNFLIIIGDDCTYSDLPLHGGQNVATPNIDALAREGLQFTHAYVSMSMCLPCRTEMYTGMYPHRSGASWNHSAARPGTKSICHYLGHAGYRVGLTGKYHVVPRDSFPFEKIKGFEPGCVKLTAAHEVSGVRDFIGRDHEQPFCLVVGLVTPHVPWSVGDPSHFNQKKLQLPPHLADTPQTREDFARYLAEIEVMDQQVGDVLEVLEQSGQSDDTLVLFTSEQGAQFPGCKWTNWELGVHTAFVARWPGDIKAGTRTDAIIQYADVLPTLLDAASVDATDLSFDGTSFLPVLLGDKSKHRKYAYSMHNNTPEGPPYPIRSVRDAEFRYIRNLTPEATYIERHLMGRADHNPYWSTWMYASPFNERAYNLVRRYMHRPADELYRTAEDPFEMDNLADDPKYAEVKKRLSEEVDRWMKEQGDPGTALDTREAWNKRRAAAGLARRKN